MYRTHELEERMTAAAARAKEAYGKDNDAFDAAMAEVKAIEPDLVRARQNDSLDRIATGTPLTGTTDEHLSRELRKFSPLKLVAHASGMKVDAGRELELQPELERRAGQKAKGLFMPIEALETRVLTTSTGSELVPTEHRPDLYVSALMASSVLRSLGARTLSGLTGNLSIPRETDSPSTAWVAENAAIPSDDADFDGITMSPKHVGARSEWSRNMLLQSSPDIDGLFRQGLARNIALAIDRAAIKGGGSNEPVGVLSTSGIQKVTSPTSIFAAVAEAVAKADIENVGASRAIITTPEVRQIAATALDLMGRPIGVDTVFHNVPTTFTNQVPKTLGGGAEHGLIYADWTELLIGVWSEIDILVNPFESTAYSKGNVAIRAMASVDVAVRHPKAFVSVEDVTTSTIAMPADES